jgi:LysM repeat protein
MQKWKIVCMLLVLSVVSKVKAQESYDQRVKNYIEHYKDWAMEEQRRSGVPAAITLAQGIHETSAGTSELALNANNHFGIKCKKEWNGETYAYTDDAPDECFRKYPSAFQSYKDHSDYLAGSQRYSALFKLSAKDYSGWCVGLKRCGYATNPKYSQILIKLIEEYNLQQYTYAALSDDYNPVKSAAQQEKKTAGVSQAIPSAQTTSTMSDLPGQISSPLPQPGSAKKSSMSVSYGATAQTVKKNEDDEYVPTDDPQNPEYGKLVKVAGLKAFYAKKGTVLLEDAFRFNIRYSKLLEINELPDLPLHADMYIFLDKKNPKGIHETHVVEPGETLSTIAQAEAMQLRYLKYYNHIGANEEPVAGALLQLQHYSEDKPATVVKDVAPVEAEPEAFAGSHPGAIPQGATRMRAGYISKKEIRAAEKEDLTIAKADKEEVVQEPIVPEEKAQEETQTPQATDEPKKDAPEMASAVAEEPVKSSETENEAITTDTATIAPAQDITVTTPPTEEVLKSDTTIQTSALEDTTESALVAKKEEIEYEVVQPEPVIEDSKKEVLATTVTNEQPKEQLHEADTIATITPVNPGVSSTATEIPKVKAPEKAALPPEEPKDEYAKLKARLDKVVYASDNTVAEIEKPKKEEEKKPEDTKQLEDSKKEVAADPAANKKDASKFYKVKKGDTAFGIAKKNNITMRQLMDWNKLDFKTIKVGQELRVK